MCMRMCMCMCMCMCCVRVCVLHRGIVERQLLCFIWDDSSRLLIVMKMVSSYHSTHTHTHIHTHVRTHIHSHNSTRMIHTMCIQSITCPPRLTSDTISLSQLSLVRSLYVCAVMCVCVCLHMIYMIFGSSCV